MRNTIHDLTRFAEEDIRLDQRTLALRRTLCNGDIIVKRRWFPGRNSEFGVYIVDMNERDHKIRRGSFLEYSDAMFFANTLLNKEEMEMRNKGKPFQLTYACCWKCYSFISNPAEMACKKHPGVQVEPDFYCDEFSTSEDEPISLTDHKLTGTDIAIASESGDDNG